MKQRGRRSGWVVVVETRVATNGAEDMKKVESEEAKLIDPDSSITNSSSAIES